MSDPFPNPEPPLVSRVVIEPPPVRLPEQTPRSTLPRSGLVDGIFLTIGFAVVLFGSIIAIVLTASFWVGLDHGADALEGAPGAAKGTVSSLPPILARALAWSFPVGYAAGFLYAILVFRIVVGRGWTRQVGLHHLPITHFVLALLAFPAFTTASDLIARVLFHLFGGDMDQSGELRELFHSFHWTFVVLAIGVGPGIVEELWCRGFLGRGFVSRYGWWAGVGLTSLFFGLLHMYPPPYVLVTAVMGLGLHFMYAMSRSLWVPVSIHFLNNSYSGLVAVGAISSEASEVPASRLVIVIALTAASLVSVGLAMWSARVRVVLPDEAGSIPSRGVMVPTGLGAEIRPSRLQWPYAIAVAVFSGALLASLLL